MDEDSGGDPQDVLGMPIQPGHRLPRTDPTEQRVLGVPISWFRQSAVDFSALRHPIRWAKWRIQRHRLGPYAPDRPS